MLEKQDKGEEHEIYYYRYSWVKLIRPITLTGSISPTIAGTLYAASQGDVKWGLFAVFLVTIVVIQATINMLNDYFDFNNGQDWGKWVQQKTNTLIRKPHHDQIPGVAILLIIISVISGIYLTVQSGFSTAIIGVLAILGGYFYSAGSKSLASIGLGEVVAAICLGILPTVLAYFIHGNPVDIKIIYVSLPFVCIIAVMILANNIRDLEKDKGFRKTLAMILGRYDAHFLLVFLLSFSYIFTFLFILKGILPHSVSMILLAIPFAIKAHWCFRFHAHRVDEINGMKWAAWHHWAFSILFNLGFALSLF